MLPNLQIRKGSVMALSAPRLTIYALLSAVEEDLRHIAAEHVGETLALEQALGEELVKSAIYRYEAENGSVHGQLTFDELLPYVDLGDLVSTINRHRKCLPQDDAKYLKSVNSQLERLLPIRKRIAHVRPFRYDDLATVTSFTDQVASERPRLWANLTETVAMLGRDPSFVFDLPQPRYEPVPDSAEHNLPLPEFDDTGFLGRVAEVKTVLDVVKGPYPVVSLVGEGGLGKTALALQCCYDLLDDASSPFDAIIWTSSKTTRLDSSQIRDIDDSIRDSLGLFSAISSELIGVEAAPTQMMDDIIEYLSEFKILLVLDNLETVIDDRVRSLLDRLPQGSKVLITSRIGVGEYEKRISLQALPNSEAARLIRKVASLSGVRALSTLPEDRLAAICERLKNNPLFIKWYVSSVQAGATPEDALVDTGVFLDFCMSNVYEHLSDPAQELLKVLLAAPSELSLPELIYFNSDDAHGTQGAIQELLTTNMLLMGSTPTDDARIVETRYKIGDLPRMYLTRHHPLTPAEDRGLAVARGRLADHERKISHQISGDPYDPMSVGTRSRSDLLIARHLFDAVRCSAAGDIPGALDAVSKAKSIGPDYYECFRVEAQIHERAGNTAIAQSQYDMAVTQAPEAPAVRLYYARFLRSSRQDVDGAVAQLEVGLKLDPDAPALKIELIRCLIQILSFSEARSHIQDLILRFSEQSKTVPEDLLRLACDCYVAEANFAAGILEHSLILSALEGLRREVDAIPNSRLRAVLPRIALGIGALWCVCNESEDDGALTRASVLVEWMQKLPGIRLPYVVNLSDEVVFGSVKFTHPTSDYGFIEDVNGADLFFSKSTLVSSDDFVLLKPGQRVCFQPRASGRGRRAIDVEIA